MRYLRAIRLHGLITKPSLFVICGLFNALVSLDACERICISANISFADKAAAFAFHAMRIPGDLSFVARTAATSKILGCAALSR